MSAASVRTVLFVLVCVASCARGAESIVGSVKTAEGAVVRRGAKTIAATPGLHLLLSDTLQTSANGRLGAILQDGTRIALGPNTELKIGQFLFEPAQAKFGLFLGLLRGVLCYVSGKIAKFAPETVRVETPVGVVGLRGTHFAVSIDEQ